MTTRPEKSSAEKVAVRPRKENRDMRTKHKVDACFVLCREALRARLVTQIGFPERTDDTSPTKRQANSALSAMPKGLYV